LRFAPLLHITSLFSRSMKIALIALCVFLFVALSSSQIQLVDNQWLLGNTIGVASPRELTFSWTNIYSLPVEPTITYYPCFGFIDLYVAVNQPALPTNYSLHYPWAEHVFVEFGTLMDVGDTINLLFVGTSTFPASSISAAFDLILNAGFNGTVFDNGVPTPGNGGTVTGALAKGGASGHLTWTLTGNKNDNYTLYALNSTSFNTGTTGYYSLNGCSTQRSMWPLTSGVTLSTSGNSETAQFSDLNPRKTLPVTTVVFRAGGYSSAYEVIYLNSASVSGALLPLMVSMFLLVVLF